MRLDVLWSYHPEIWNIRTTGKVQTWILQLRDFSCGKTSYRFVNRGPGLSEHYSDVIMGVMASQITSLTIVYSTVYSGTDQRKHQSSTSLAFVRGIHRWPLNSPHKWPVTRKMFPFDDVIMKLPDGCRQNNRHQTMANLTKHGPCAYSSGYTVWLVNIA